MEFVDLYDGDRNFTGRKVVRGEKYEEGLYKLSVHIWITNNEGKIYIQKRAESRKMFPNYWENPGGGVISGQDSETTLKREFEEELGIPMSGKYELIKSIKRKKDFVDIYHLTQDFEIDELHLQDEEVSEARWVDINELKDMVDKGLFCPTIMDSLVPFLEYINK